MDWRRPTPLAFAFAGSGLQPIRPPSNPSFKWPPATNGSLAPTRHTCCWNLPHAGRMTLDWKEVACLRAPQRVAQRRGDDLLHHPVGCSGSCGPVDPPDVRGSGTCERRGTSRAGRDARPSKRPNTGQILVKYWSNTGQRTPFQTSIRMAGESRTPTANARNVRRRMRKRVLGGTSKSF
jgi:hypothetical protein